MSQPHKENYHNPCPASPLWAQKYKLDIQNRYWHWLLDNKIDTYDEWCQSYLDVSIHDMQQQMQEHQKRPPKRHMRPIVILNQPKET